MTESNSFTSPTDPPPQTAPVRVRIPLSKPLITYLLLAINVIVYLVDMLLRRQLTALGAKDNGLIVAGEYWRLFTPIFLHVGLWHVGLNSYFLYVFGPQMERHYGYIRFLLIYLLSGIAGAVASFALTPSPSIGASGALFGLLGAMLPFLYRNRNILSDTRSRIMSILQVIGINLVLGLLVGSIDNWGHVGGLLGGAALAWFATPRYAVGSVENGALQIRDRSSPMAFWLAAAGVFAVLIGITALLISSRTP
jgi:rhomboid protease GluP